MSLHVGHIPPHIRPEELQRAFRRFGPCILKMKDGYGFAVYDVSSDAKAALRSLKGKYICGEPLSLNWSNRQPRPFQRSARPNKIYEPYQRRYYREEENGVGYRGSQDRREFSSGYTNTEVNNRGRHRDDELDRGADQDDVLDRGADRDDVLDRGAGQDDVLDGVLVPEDNDAVGEERNKTLKKGVTDVRNSSEPNLMENDRWGEPVSNGITGNEMHDGADFDHYEPYHGYNREEEKESNRWASSYGSPYHVSPRENVRREHPAEVSRKKRRRRHHADEAPPAKRADYSADEGDKNIDNSKSQPTCFNCGLAGHIKRYCPEGDTKRGKFSNFSHSKGEINFRGRTEGKLKRPRTSSWGRLDVSRDPLISRGRECVRKESHFRKSKRLMRSEDLLEKRKKNCHNPSAVSRAKKHSKQQHETQKAVQKKRGSRKTNSQSVSLVSSTSNSWSRSRTSKSKSHARSHSTSKSKSSRFRSASFSSRSASLSSYSRSKSPRSRSRSRSSSHRSPSLSNSLDKRLPSFSGNVNLNVSEYRASPKGNLEQGKMENFVAQDENGQVTREIGDDFGKEHSASNVNEVRYSSSSSGNNENSSDINPHKGISAVTDSIDKGSLQETLPVNSNDQIAQDSKGRNSTRITTQEMILALKYYGLPAPEEGQSNISVEGYFGAARFWPWEMIYYRRLKKGPISTENYARRIQQNKEFGIVDRYIRSSSGWGESEQNDTL